MQNMPSFSQPGQDEDDTVTLEKDLLLNLLVVFLLLVGGQSLIANAKTVQATPHAMRGHAVHIFLEDDGDLHWQNLSSAHVSLDEILAALRTVRESAAENEAPRVFIHHTAETPAGKVHALLRAVGQTRGDVYLALSQYSALACEKGDPL